MIDTFDFSEALGLLKLGNKVSRSGWNGKGMFLYLVPGSVFPYHESRLPVTDLFNPGDMITYLPHIDMYTAQGELVPWLASQSDILADDWTLVE